MITRGGITTDLLRNLLYEEDLPSKLLAARIPPCALATVDDPTVVMIASTAPRMSLSSTATHNRYRFTSRDSRHDSTERQSRATRLPTTAATIQRTRPEAWNAQEMRADIPS